MSTNVIAIDGPSASGKSTIAQKLSERLSVPYINTGNMYRALTWYAMQHGIKPKEPNQQEAVKKILADVTLKYVKNADGKYELHLNGELASQSIRAPETAANVSFIAAMPCVRDWMLDKQQAMKSIGLIVMEGRDIGTVIFPDAKYKFFLTASPRVRAMRRLAQAGETLEGSTVDSVAREIEERDKLDMNRPVAPLKKADDAVLIDSSDKDVEQTLTAIISYIKK